MVKKEADKTTKPKKSTKKSTTESEVKEKATTRKKKIKESSEDIIETPKKEKKVTKKTTKVSKEPKKEETKVVEKVTKKTTKKTATKKVDDNKEVVKKTTRKAKVKQEPIVIQDPVDPNISYEISDAPPIAKAPAKASPDSLLLTPVHEPTTLLPKESNHEGSKVQESSKPKKQGLLLTPVREPRTLLPKGYVKETESVRSVPEVKVETPPIKIPDKNVEPVKEAAPKKHLSIADMLRAPSPKASTAKQTKDLHKEEVTEVVEEVKEEPKQVEEVKPVVTKEPKPVVKTAPVKKLTVKEQIREAIKGSDAAYHDVSTTDPIVYVGSVVDPKTGEYVSTFRKSILKTDSSDYIVDIAFAIHNRFNQFDTNLVASLLTVKDITPNKFVVRI